MKLAFVIATASVLVATACGGSTNDSGTGNAGSGGTGKGGTASGGKAGSGGTPSGGSGGTPSGGSGGTPSGGSGGAAGIGTGGAAGNAGTGKIGDACQNDSQCPSSAYGTGTCDTAAPGGYCTIVIAECPAGSGQGACPDASSCINGTQFAGKLGDFCLANCATQNDCRAGYVCCPAWAVGQATHVCEIGPACA